MIANPETVARIHAQAEAYADIKMRDLLPEIAPSSGRAPLAQVIAATDDALLNAYLAGADAGYTAAKAESREP